MSEATLQTLAYELGLDKLVREMTEAEKAQLRYIQIMRSTSEWQTDMGRTIITPANALRVMQQQFIQLGRAIGKVFIPIVMMAMPYVIALTELLTKLAKKLANILANLFGIELVPDIDYSKLGDISAGITDIGNSASDATKKLNTMLAPFDDLNVVQTNKQKDGSGLAGIGGDLGVILPEYDALANLNTKFAEGVEDAKKNLERIIPIVLSIGTALATWKITKSVLDFMTWWGELSKLQKLLTRVSLGIVVSVAGITLKISGDEDIKNIDTLWSGVAKQIGGSVLSGAGIGLITKSFTIGIAIAGISLINSGMKTMSTGDEENFWSGLAESLAGVGLVAGSTFAQTKSLTTTLTVTALVVWGNVAIESANLIDLEPTWDEFVMAVNELPWAKVISDYILTPLFVDLPKGVGDAFDSAKTEMSEKWDEMWVSVGNWFDQEKQLWSDNWTTFTETASGMWGVMKDDISTTWNETWVNINNIFDTKKEEWTTKMTELKTNISEIWDETWFNVGNTLETKWTEAKTWFSTNFGTKEDWKRTFSSILDGATQVLNDLKYKFENWSAWIKTPHLEWKQNGIQATGAVKKILETLNLPTSLPKLNVSWYQDGGYPTSGDLFFANENGIPEMVGRIGHQTAVANNDQIATSITNALITALDQYDFGGGKSPTTIYIGNKKVYEGYGDYASEENDRYGTNVIRI